MGYKDTLMTRSNDHKTSKNTRKRKESSKKVKSRKSSYKRLHERKRVRRRPRVIRSPTKSSFKRRASPTLKVMWSPKVKQVERKTSRKKKASPKTTHLYTKVDRKRTLHTKGVLYARYMDRKTPIVILTLVSYGNTATIHINFLTQKIMYIQTLNETVHVSSNGMHRVRVLFKIGDIVWIHESKRIHRTSQCPGFNMKWLERIHDFSAKVKSSEL